MTDSTVLQRAREGKADAIAALMNHSLNSKGIYATAERAGDRLLVNLETDSLPDQALLTKFVHQGVRNLKIESIATIMVSGRVRGGDRPAWTSTIYLDAQSTDAPPTSGIPINPPPPPPPLSIQHEVNPAIEPANVAAPPPPPPPPPPLPTASAPIADDAVSDAGEVAHLLSSDDASISDDASASSDNIPAAEVLVESTHGHDGLEEVSMSGDRSSTQPIDNETSDSSKDLTDSSSEKPLYEYDVYASDQLLNDGDEPSEDQGSINGSDRLADVSYPLDDPEYLDEPESLVDDSVSDDSYSATAAQQPSPEALSINTAEKDISSIVPMSSTKKSSSSPLLLGSVLLVVVGAIGSLVGYSLWSYFSNGGSILDPGLTPTPAVAPADDTSNNVDANSEENDVTEANQINVDEVLQRADDTANNASTFSQTAQSGDDWDLIVGQWQRAIALVEQIPESDSQYASAQQRLATYRSSLALAQQQASARSVVSSAPLPSTVITVADPIECIDVAASENSQAIELTNVRFEEAVGADTTRRIVGCISNHSDEAIASATISYTVPSNGSEADGSELGGLRFSDLQAGNTVAFQGDFDLSTSINTVEISAINWVPAGSTESQSLDLALVLTGG
ncbi:MAG: hypothetical protein AAGA75_21885 [Cyanobacteria bacterium P01_E01_bin.6]